MEVHVHNLLFYVPPKRNRDALSSTELSPGTSNSDKILKLDSDFAMLNNSVADTLAGAHETLHGHTDHGGVLEHSFSHADLTQLTAAIRSIDMSVKTGIC